MGKSINSVEPVLKHKCILGEAPLWDAKRSTICWVDIIAGVIHQYNTNSHEHKMISVGQMVGCICVSTDGNFIAGLKNGIAKINKDSGAIQMIAHPEKHLPGNRFNDGRCDPAGRFWAGTMALSEEEGAGNLYMIDQLGTVSKKIEGVSISNGLAWSADHETLYYIDTPTQQVVAFDFDVTAGHISNRRVIITIPEQNGSPDGMTIDAEGMLWIAHWGGWQVSRWNPITGKQLDHIALPVSKVTSCTFGGEAFEDLYITTASIDLTAEEWKEQPLAGSLFVIKNCGYTGRQAFEYRSEKK
jgi:sugar lactone lactonase YvrE